MKKLSALFCFLAVLLTGACFSGCGQAERPTVPPDSPAYTIVTSFYPMYVLTLNITTGIEGIQVYNMAQPQTGCLHDYQLTTADMKILDSADVLIVNGAGMESFLDKVTAELPQLTVITASAGLDLLEETHTLHIEEHEMNPHIWVSPSGAAAEAHNIAQGLAAVDTAHAEQYRANAEAFAQQMQALTANMKAQLDTLSQRKLITFHEAFPYFAREFDLEIAAVVEAEPGQEPTAKEIDALIQQIQTEKLPAIFVESQYADKTAQLIAEETGIGVYELDLIVTGEATISPEEARVAYGKAMEKNLAVLMEALQ